MKRSSLLLLRNVAHGTARSPPVAVYGVAAVCKTLAPIPSKPFSDSTFSLRSPLHARSFSYYSLEQHENEMKEEWERICKEYSGGEPEVIVDPPNLITVGSGEEFETFLNKVIDESLPAVFYYTSLSSAPCRVVLPMVRELSKRNPKITSYKIDKDQEGVKSTLEKFNVSSVPHLNFFLGGKKVAELIAPETKDLWQTLQKLVNCYTDMEKGIPKDSVEVVTESNGIAIEAVAQSDGKSEPESSEEFAHEPIGESRK